VVIFADNSLLRPADCADHLSSSPPQVRKPKGREKLVGEVACPLRKEVNRGPGRDQSVRIPHRHPRRQWSITADLLAWITELELGFVK
jgi:hypothetical protein